MTTKPTRTDRRERANRSMRMLWIGGTAAALLGIILLMTVVFPSPPKHITLAGGAPGGAYHAFAEIYRDTLARQGITVDVLTTAGSQENLDLLVDQKADVAFVQSGTRDLARSPDDLRGIASLYYEPLWIFQKGQGRIEQLSEVAGKRLAVGGDRSGTQAVVLQLLQLNGITRDNAEFQTLDMETAAKALHQGDVDYGFFIGSAKADTIRGLIDDPEIQLVGISRHKAYVRNVLFVTDLEIAQGTFDLEKNIPAEDLPVLSTLATLVCHKDLHPAIVEVLTDVAHREHGKRQLLSPAGQFPTPEFLEFDIHEAADDYFQSGPSVLARYLPFWLANLVKKLLVIAIPLLTLLLPLMKIAPVLYKATMRKRIHKHYDTLDEIEDRTDAATTHEEYAACEADLARLTEIVERGIEVPSTYRNEEYDLRLHVAHVGAQLRRKRAERLGDGDGGDS